MSTLDDKFFIVHDFSKISMLYKVITTKPQAPCLGSGAV